MTMSKVSPLDADSDHDIMSLDSFGSDSDIEMDSDDEAGTISKQFDVGFITGSIERGESVLEQVKDRDVVLIVGKTGTKKYRNGRRASNNFFFARLLTLFDKFKRP